MIKADHSWPCVTRDTQDVSRQHRNDPISIGHGLVYRLHMPRKNNKKIESEIASVMASAKTPDRVDLYADRKIQRVSSGMKPTMSKLNVLLSQTQDFIGREITVNGMANRDPVSYAIGNDAYDAIERLRRRISK